MAYACIMHIFSHVSNRTDIISWCLFNSFNQSMFTMILTSEIVCVMSNGVNKGFVLWHNISWSQEAFDTINHVICLMSKQTTVEFYLLKIIDLENESKVLFKIV